MVVPNKKTNSSVPVLLPRYVQFCLSGDYVMKLRPKAAPGIVAIKPLKCLSQRCPDCARRRGFQDFLRLRNALAPRLGWLHVVFTLDRNKTGSPQEGYRDISRAWDRKISRTLSRRFGRIASIRVFHEHDDGFPHSHILMRNPALLKESQLEPKGLLRDLNELAHRAGLGHVTECERVRGIGKIASYLTKTSREPGPHYVNAPANTRLIQASRRLIPRRRGSGLFTVEVVKRHEPRSP